MRKVGRQCRLERTPSTLLFGTSHSLHFGLQRLCHAHPQAAHPLLPPGRLLQWMGSSWASSSIKQDGTFRGVPWKDALAAVPVLRGLAGCPDCTFVRCLGREGSWTGSFQSRGLGHRQEAADGFPLSTEKQAFPGEWGSVYRRLLRDLTTMWHLARVQVSPPDMPDEKMPRQPGLYL